MSGTEGGWSWRQKLLLQVALIPVALGLLELGVRGYRAAAGRPYTTGGARAEILGAIDTIQSPLPSTPEQRLEAGLSKIKDEHVLHPYYGFTTPGDMAEVAALTDSFAHGQGENSYVVMLLGGSVAGLFGGYLRAWLEQDPRLAGRDVRLINLGRGANRQPQQLVRAMLMQGLDVVPDALINLDGFNEAAFGRNNFAKGVHPSYPYAPRWLHLTMDAGSEQGLNLAAEVLAHQQRTLEVARAALDGPWLASAITGPRQLARVSALSTGWIEAQGRYETFLLEDRENVSGRGPAFNGDEDAVTESVLRTWFECSVALAAHSKTRGIEYLHVLQPTLYDKGSKPLTEVEVGRGRHAKSYRQGVMACYPRMREMASELSGAGVRFLDLSMLYVDVEEEIYTDYCHVNDLGNELLVGPIVEVLLGEGGD